MRFAFRVTVAILLCLWSGQAAKAEDDLVAKAQNERELNQILNMDKPPAIPRFQPEYLRGVNFFPADWTLSDSYEEHSKIYREIFWKNQ